MNRNAFLPVSRDDLASRGWDDCDFIIVSGDAYVDHPSFAAAILGRLLESQGFSVGIIAQPEWQGPQSEKDFTRLGKPRLAWLVTAGAMDSMVARYTANNKPRSEDAYSPGGKAGFRPDRALLAYTSCIRAVGAQAPIIVGGIEASLRRFAHYDYWSNTLRRSILLDTKADLLVYGMGENPLTDIALTLKQIKEEGNLSLADTIRSLRGIRGTMWRTGKKEEIPAGALILPSFTEISASAQSYCDHFLLQEQHTDPINAYVLVEQSEERFVVQEKPAMPLESPQFDRVMELPYTRTWHPDYEDAGGIPAIEEVKFSLVSARGCFGACSFCAIGFHQGRQIQTRSHDSLEREARLLSSLTDFKGYIHDLGGPTANFREPSCAAQRTRGSCKDRQCLGSAPCPALQSDHRDYLTLLRRIRALPGIKKVFIRSGIRFDYLMLDSDPTFLRELCEYHISGQLKVAPEHTSDSVLTLMRKSNRAMYKDFETAYERVNRELGKKQYLVPYYISAHPGCTLSDAVDMALALHASGFIPDQVQDFYPTPGTLSTCMYYTGLDPYTRNPVYVPKGARERALHRALMQYNKKENWALVREALEKAGRKDAEKILLGGRGVHKGRKT